jgi:hypothetical protein
MRQTLFPTLRALAIRQGRAGSSSDITGAERGKVAGSNRRSSSSIRSCPVLGTPEIRGRWRFGLRSAGNTPRCTDTWRRGRARSGQRRSEISRGFSASDFPTAPAFTAHGGPTKANEVATPMRWRGRWRAGGRRRSIWPASALCSSGVFKLIPIPHCWYRVALVPGGLSLSQRHQRSDYARFP